MLFISTIQNAFRSQDNEQKKKQAQQIDSSLINKILQLEEIIHDRQYNMGHVTSLLENYGEMVQHFDQEQQSMKLYFLEKMQFLLSRAETIRLMAEQDEDQDLATRLTSMRTTKDINQLKCEEEARFNRPFLQQVVNEKTQQMRFSVYKKHRAKEMQICIEIEDQKHDQVEDLKHLIQEYEVTSKEFDSAIKKQLDDQNKQLKNRMAQRKNNRSKRQSNSQESKRGTMQKENNNNQTVSKWKLISQIEESVSFMRHSINKLKK